MDTDRTSPPAAAPEESATAQPSKPRELHPSEPRRGNKPLPTNRIAFGKQLDLLRAFGAAGGVERKAVSISSASEMVGMTAATASLANGWFVDAKLLAKVEGPQPTFQPSAEVRDFTQAHEWAPDIAAQKLAPALQLTWAWTALEPQLRYSPSISEIDAVRYLATACGASPDYRPQLILVLQYLEAASLIVRDGLLIRRVEGRAATTPPPVTPETPTGGNGTASDRLGPKGGGSASGGGGRVEGQIRFAVSMNLDVSELRGWSPDRIARLFEGISKVMAAKGGEEEDDEPTS